MKIYTCCSRSTDHEGCGRGPHVFYESDPEDLHRRHAFTFTRPPISTEYPDAGGGTEDSAYDIVALDCEMIYSTGGMRVARVSIVDGTGKEIFDEIIRMDDGVEVMCVRFLFSSLSRWFNASDRHCSDFNTRFSGITPENYATAVLPLASIRKALDGLINSDTIIIGHALDNDLKTLRMIHHRCVDTASLYPHKLGPPYKRALRDLWVIITYPHHSFQLRYSHFRSDRKNISGLLSKQAAGPSDTVPSKILLPLWISCGTSYSITPTPNSQLLLPLYLDSALNWIETDTSNSIIASGYLLASLLTSHKFLVIRLLAFGIIWTCIFVSCYRALSLLIYRNSILEFQTVLISSNKKHMQMLQLHFSPT